MHFYAEHCYSGRCTDNSAIINYYYLRCCARDTLVLPTDKKYKVEVIDTWNMTREVVLENASGKVTVALPGKPYMAVIAHQGNNTSQNQYCSGYWVNDQESVCCSVYSQNACKHTSYA
ncbi:hypothetical protein SAMN02910263_04513 [Butyrivibrio sp. INlla16]|nr:hypothetical protein SAMN02910263_04513 [Butyrivibrio sp. INlla16]